MKIIFSEEEPDHLIFGLFLIFCLWRMVIPVIVSRLRPKGCSLRMCYVVALTNELVKVVKSLQVDTVDPADPFEPSSPPLSRSQSARCE